MADPDLQIKGRGLILKKILSALQAYVWSKNKGGAAPQAATETGFHSSTKFHPKILE